MLLLLLGLGLGFGVSVIAIGARLGRRPKALPAAGEPPRDRGEAVRRVLKHLQRKSIAELGDGTAAVVLGTVRPLPGVPLLRAPFTGTECVGYHLDIRAARLEYGFHFPQLREEARCVSFEVVDPTGTLLVSADGLELAVTDGPIGRWDPPLPPHVAVLVPGYPYFSVTVEEGLLMPGAQVLVCGVAVRELAPTDYRDGAHALVMRATATFPLVASSDADLFKETQRPIAPEELRNRR